MTLSRLFITVSALALIAGCAAGPDFEHPPAPDVAGYDSQPLPDRTASTDNEAGAAQTFANGQDIPAAWWTLFHSEPLDKLVAAAIKANPDLIAAQASLRAAEEDVRAEESVLFPTVTGSFSSTREKITGASAGGLYPGTIFTLHNASVGVSYGLDVFGGARRAIEQSEAEADMQRFETEAAYLSLTANVVTAAIEEASLRGQIDATRKIMQVEDKQLDLLQQQLQLGGISKLPSLAGEAALAQTKATLPALEKQLAQVRHLLATLTGQFPNAEPPGTFTLADLKLPGQLPVSLPSKLVEQRPDVRAAEANLHAASAAIGVAEAARLPGITLSAGIGSEANHLDDLFGPGSGAWNVGAGAAETLFDAGALRHQQRAAEAEYDAAAAQYRKTVLAAFKDVADTLRALEADAETLKQQAAAEQAAAASLSLAQDQYDAGAISYLNLLGAEQTEQQAQLALVGAEAQRYADTAALFAALGGGWWNRADDPAKPATQLSPLADQDGDTK